MPASRLAEGGAGADAPAVHSIPHLVAAARDGIDGQHFARLVEAMSSRDTRTLIVSIETTADPAMLWHIHFELHTREIAPCFRWPGPRDPDLQTDFVTFAADLLWLCTRGGAISPQYRGWRTLVATPTGTAAWHALVHRQYMYALGRSSIVFWCCTGLGLTAGQRQDLMTLPTKEMNAERRQLRPDQFREIVGRLEVHAEEHRDKAKKVTPGDVAWRRASLWRTFILTGRNRTATATYWKRISGSQMTRQAVSKQLDIVAAVLRRRR